MVPHELHALRVQTRPVYEKADALYAPYSCPASGECCQLRTTGRPPWLWRSEWEVLLDALKQQGRTLPRARDDGGCPFLDASGLRCSVYQSRPLGCRTFFCGRIRGPATQPRDELNALMVRLEALNRRFDEDAEAKSLPQWHAEAVLSAER